MLGDYLILLLVITIISPFISVHYLHDKGSHRENSLWGSE